MTAHIITVPRLDGHIGYDDIGYYLTFPFELVPLPEQSITARMRSSTSINVMNYNRPEIRVSVSTVPTR